MKTKVNHRIIIKFHDFARKIMRVWKHKDTNNNVYLNVMRISLREL